VTQLAETYATRYAEGDKSWDSLVRLFDAAMREATNRERELGRVVADILDNRRCRSKE